MLIIENLYYSLAQSNSNIFVIVTAFRGFFFVPNQLELEPRKTLETSLPAP